MPLVRVKDKFQVTIPSTLRERVGLDVGDLLEARIHRGVITLTPKRVVDRRIAEGLEDLRAGRSYGPYSSVAEAIEAFNRRTGRARSRKPARGPGGR
jgi:AbrB family looped-hinge helix DNA binding protein